MNNVYCYYNEFNPFGISGVVVIAESHMAIHSWPEYLCASVDIFTCSPAMRPEDAIEFLQRIFGAKRVEIKEVERALVSALSSSGVHSHLDCL